MFKLFRRPASHRSSANYEHVLGTSLEIQVVASDEAIGTLAERAVLAEIERLESIFSVYQPTSEFNRWQSTRDVPMAISRELSEVLVAATLWRSQSNGAFEPTVEALTRRWRESTTTGDGIEFDPRAPLWEVDGEHGTATRRTSLPASLNAIAKGYIIDCAVEKVAAIPGVTDVMINLGGDLRHVGAQSIPVRITDPVNHADNDLHAVSVTLSNAAVATSGGYRRGFDVDGKHVSHIFDPSTRRPADNIASASVIAPDAMTADAIATVLSVLDPEEGLAFADRFDSVGAFLVTYHGSRTSNAYWRRCQNNFL